jgi:hypothetical protein
MTDLKEQELNTLIDKSTELLIKARKQNEELIILLKKYQNEVFSLQCIIEGLEGDLKLSETKNQHKDNMLENYSKLIMQATSRYKEVHNGN